MDWQRKKSSYALWFLYLIAACMGLLTVSQAFCDQREIKGNFIWLLFAGVLLIGGLFSVAICILRRRFLNEITVGKKLSIALPIIEILLVAGIMGAGIMARMECIEHSEVGSLYELAMMKYQTPLVELTHGAENVYLHILHFICFLLGNNSYFCICLHMALTVLVGVIWYLAVRNLSGSVSALVFLSFYFLDPYMTKQSASLSPMPIFLFFYGIGLLFVSAFLKYHASFILISLFAGIWIGITGYMDVFGWTLLIFAFSIYHVMETEYGGRKGRKLTASLLLVLGALVGFGCMILVKTLHTGQQFFTVLNNWGNQYIPSGMYDIEKLRALSKAFPDALIPLMAILFGIFGLCSFYFRGKKERISPWIGLLIVCMAALPVSFPFLENYAGIVPGASAFVHKVDFVIGGGEMIVMCMYVLAGLGIYGVLMPENCVEVKGEKTSSVKNLRVNYQEWKATRKQIKEKKKAELLYAVDHPETMEGKNFISMFLYKRAKQKIERQRDADKVMHALNSLSGDHIVIEDFSRDPHPEEAKNETGLFHVKKHAETALDEVSTEEIKAVENQAEEIETEESKAEEIKKEETRTEGIKTEEAKTEETKPKDDESEDGIAEEAKPKDDESEDGMTGGDKSEGGKSEDAMSKDDTSEDVKTEDRKAVDDGLEAGMTGGDKSEGGKPEDAMSKDDTSEDVKTEDLKAEDDKAEDGKSEGGKPEDVVSKDVKSEETMTEGATEEITKPEENGKVTDKSEENGTEARETELKKAEQGGTKEGKVEAEKIEKNQMKENKPAEPGKVVHYLENPLPLPKKAVFDPMDYDYEVADDDDYDLNDDD